MIKINNACAAYDIGCGVTTSADGPEVDLLSSYLSTTPYFRQADRAMWSGLIMFQYYFVDMLDGISEEHYAIISSTTRYLPFI